MSEIIWHRVNRVQAKILKPLLGQSFIAAVCLGVVAGNPGFGAAHAFKAQALKYHVFYNKKTYVIVADSETAPLDSKSGAVPAASPAASSRVNTQVKTEDLSIDPKNTDSTVAPAPVTACATLIVNSASSTASKCGGPKPGGPKTPGISQMTQQAAAAQSVTASVSQIVGSQAQNIAGTILDQQGSDDAGGGSGGQQQVFNTGVSFFAMSGVSQLQHHGLNTAQPKGSGRGPEFDALTYTGTVAGRFDGSSLFALRPKTLTLGAFGSYTSSDITSEGVNGKSTASVDAYSLGSYSLINLKPFYLLGVFNYGWGTAAVSEFPGANLQDRGLSGYAVSGNAGVVLPLDTTLKVDLRTGLTYSATNGAKFTDGVGFFYNNGRVEDLSGTASAKLFSVHRAGQWTLRPFLQGGGTQRIDYTNDVRINGVMHRFNDAETSAFGRFGIDADQSDGVQAYLAFRGEVSAKSEILSGQVGLTFKLD